MRIEKKALFIFLGKFLPLKLIAKKLPRIWVVIFFEHKVEKVRLKNFGFIFILLFLNIFVWTLSKRARFAEGNILFPLDSTIVYLNRVLGMERGWLQEINSDRKFELPWFDSSTRYQTRVTSVNQKKQLNVSKLFLINV